MSDEQPPGEKTLLVPPVWFLIFVIAEVLVGRAVPGPLVSLPFAPFIAVACGAAGLGFAVVALGLFKKAGTTYHPTVPGEATALVTSGVYQYTRNPMYVGMALVLFGIAIWYGSVLAFLLMLAFIGLVTAVQILPEEKALERLFGDEYRIYKHNVPRWLFF